MRLLIIAFQALTLWSTDRTLAIPIPANDVFGPSIDTHSLGLPVRPSRDLANTDVAITEQPIAATFEPPHLYYNLYYFLVIEWRLSSIIPITTPRTLRSGSPGGGFIKTTMQPTAGSQPFNFNTAVATAVLERMLEQITIDDLQPRLLTATLTTRGYPSRVVGTVMNEYIPPAPSMTLAPADFAFTTTENLTVSSNVDVHVHFFGQSLNYPRITQQIWFEALTGLTAQILAQARAFEDLRTRPYLTYIQSHTSSYSLRAKVSVMAAPLGKRPMKTDGLMQATTLMLIDVIQARRYELMRVDIVNDDWVAATYELEYVTVSTDV
ncbi:MAG: hypothetical protein L6R41_008212 [Letrouitia leprolyta]|nr:MAG: hypothetical protein L6R41_008212 [Letrouitia leprolyta]